MQRKIAAVARVGACLLLVMVASAFAADANSSKSAVGNWILNPTKSHFQNMPAPKMERLRVSKDDETGLKWSLTGADADGKGYHQEYDGPHRRSLSLHKGCSESQHCGLCQSQFCNELGGQG